MDPRNSWTLKLEWTLLVRVLLRLCRSRKGEKRFWMTWRSWRLELFYTEVDLLKGASALGSVALEQHRMTPKVEALSNLWKQSSSMRLAKSFSKGLSARFILLSKQMDRSWIYGTQFTPAYVKGVEEFMKFVSERYPEYSHILSAYTRWIHHGESTDTVVVENLEQEVEGSDHDFGIHVDVADDDYDEDHRVPEMIGDLYAAAEADGEQPRFARVLEDAKKSLSPGSSHSKFSFLLLSSGYPQSELPKSYDEAKKYLGELGLGFENIHVCKNNCVLFWKRYYKENVCPVCKASRWQDETGNKRVPHKVLRHFPLLPRLKRIFASKRTSEETQWHKKTRTLVDNVMSHPADGEAWKEFNTREPTFVDDLRNLRLALATDGFNPFGNMSAKSPGKDFDLFLEPLIEELLDLWKGQHGNLVTAPPALYVLGKDQKIKFCKFLKGIKFPNGYAANLARYISEDGSKVQGKLKTHSCHILLQRIIPASLRGLVRKDVYEAVAELGTFFKELCSRNLRIDVVKRLKEEIPLILCKLEKIFPPAFFDVMVHLAVHLPNEALLRGPIQYGWMYPIERLLGTLKNFVRNMARLEGSIVEAYMASDTLTFCSRYMEDIDNRFSHDDGSDGEMPLPDDIYVFKHGVTLVGSNRSQYIDDVDLNKLVWDDLEQQGALDVDKMVEQGFAKWFRCHIENKRKENLESVSEGLWALSRGPDLRVKTCAACKVNGVRYSTVDRENFLLTQNSGVMTEGSHDGNNIDFYGVLKESLWYKTDPFILATQLKKIFYLQDTSLGKDWRVVQKFEHRNIYDVAEKDEASHDVHQDDYCSDTEHVVQAGADNEVTHNIQGGEASIIEGNLQDLISSKKQPIIREDSEDEEEDETRRRTGVDAATASRGHGGGLEVDWRGRDCSLSRTWRWPGLDLGADTEAGGLPLISSLQRGRIDAEPGSLTRNPASGRRRRRSAISPWAAGPD
ncbi:uncharacterized protein [Miscanthus floridulus]|uniref:uncharacterized protein n=1 Tax=Miscanthus floridulus TaxID=154761 RepID=UPI00345AAF66